MCRENLSSSLSYIFTSHVIDGNFKRFTKKLSCFLWLQNAANHMYFDSFVELMDTSLCTYIFIYTYTETVVPIQFLQV